MNIEISNTIQTFEQENEIKKNSNKLLFGRFFANPNFVQERLLNVPNMVSIKSSKFTPYTGYNISSTVILEPILWLLSVLLRNFQTSWNPLFYLVILFS